VSSGNPNWDLLVVTASNAPQARAYEAQLRTREEQGRLPHCRDWLVVPDPKGRRVGSGGSTLAVLALLASKALRQLPASDRAGATLPGLFASSRVLVLHSGGDSRRLPAYAATGKVFAPLPALTRDGHAATLFDLVLDDLSALPSDGRGRVLLAAGDVLLGVGHSGLDLNAPGVVGAACPLGEDRAARHGVYAADSEGTVLDFLQKPTPELADQRGARLPDGRLLVDLGLVSISAEACATWLEAAGATLVHSKAAPGKSGKPRAARLDTGQALLASVLRADSATIDLYEHVLMAHSPRLDRAGYLNEVARRDPGALEARKRRLLETFYQGCRGLPFRVGVVPACDFLHVGTTREFLDIVRKRPPTRAKVDWLDSKSAVVMNSRTPAPLAPREACTVVEACDLLAAPTFKGDGMLVGVPRELARIPSFRRWKVPAGIGLVCLPVGRSDWAVVVFGVGDDFKTPASAGGTLCGHPLSTIVGESAASPRAFGDGSALHRGRDGSAWSARLWTVGTIRAAWEASRRLVAGNPLSAGRRASLAELLPIVNPERAVAHRAALERQAWLARVLDTIGERRWVSAAAIAAAIPDPTTARATLAALHRAIAAARPHGPTHELDRARLTTAASLIAARFPRASPSTPPALEREAFAAVARAVEVDLGAPAKPRRSVLLPDQVVWVTTPVRIDLAGGWSDTPPICHEVGGDVVNMAITLNGQYPVQVMARLSDEPRIRLSSVDLGKSVTFRTAAEILDYSDPHDWAALPKAALALSGIVPRHPSTRHPRTLARALARALATLGGGLDLTMFSALPKGSGLGTSSILGAAFLACLDRVLGLHHGHPGHASLIRRTSLLEQMMSTAGGWQDQAGGITPGIKLLTTQPGPHQVPTLEPLPFGDGATRDVRSRMLLYYTGMRRLARGILQGVVSRWLARDPASLRIVRELKSGAHAMAAALRSGDADAFAAGVADYWRLKRSIDPGATTASIERIVAPISKYLAAHELPGAGGGGFLFLIARDAYAAQKIRRELERHPPNPAARFFHFDIDQKGLGVSVL
jgi:fucokinase